MVPFATYNVKYNVKKDKKKTRMNVDSKMCVPIRGQQC